MLLCFIAVPTFLTFLSLRSAHPRHAEALKSTSQSRGRFQALFSFNTPSSLFPPSAIISLTDDNSTFFLARPAAFGPALASKGLSGQLWVGSGFGDSTWRKGGATFGAEGELGCSDVPGWSEDHKKEVQQKKAKSKQKAVLHAKQKAESSASTSEKGKRADVPKEVPPVATEDAEDLSEINDGTDDHLHHPLPESNPAAAGKLGEDAKNDKMTAVGKTSTHADIQSLQEGAEIAGKIVLLSRGGCGFLEKVKWTQRRGGIGLIVGDDERGGPLITMYARGDTSNITIPALFTSHTTAHLLSSLIPPELLDTNAETNEVADNGKSKSRTKIAGPVFTTTPAGPISTGVRHKVTGTAKVGKSVKTRKVRRGWFRSILSAFGISDDMAYSWHFTEDSRRPPSSGSLDWELENFHEEKTDKKSASVRKAGYVSNDKIATTKGKAAKGKLDDFVIGVQDWRDPDLVATKNDKTMKPSNTVKDEKKVEKSKPAEAEQFKGGSITPGSGEYDRLSAEDDEFDIEGDNVEEIESDVNGAEEQELEGWLARLRWGQKENKDFENGQEKGPETSSEKDVSVVKTIKPDSDNSDSEDERRGLWVTLTPTSMSTSPFFDTLLVLVISPLVTLTIVYALLLLRSRIRRRRWRAPKSVVERLPVRTYHTMSSASSTTSSQHASPHESSPTSPLLRSSSQPVSARARPRSQTTTGVVSSSSAGS